MNNVDTNRNVIVNFVILGIDYNTQSFYYVTDNNDNFPNFNLYNNQLSDIQHYQLSKIAEISYKFAPVEQFHITDDKKHLNIYVRGVIPLDTKLCKDYQWSKIIVANATDDDKYTIIYKAMETL